MCGPGQRIPASGPNSVTTSRPGRRTRAGAEPFSQEPIPGTRPRHPLPTRFGHIARSGDHSTPAAAPLRIYPARSAGPGFRVSPSVRIPGNCAYVRPPHRMPPPTRTANRIIGRTRLSGCGPPPTANRPTHTMPRPVLIPSGHCPCRLLALPPTHTAPGPDPAPVRPILPIPFAPFSLYSAYSASFSRLLLRAFPFL